MKILVPAILLILSLNSSAKLLDKIAGVINDKVFSLSELKRIQSTVSARKEIAPFIYTKNKYTINDILKLQHRVFIVKDKLSEQGFVVSDDSVEARIKDTWVRTFNLFQSFNPAKVVIFIMFDKIN